MEVDLDDRSRTSTIEQGIGSITCKTGSKKAFPESTRRTSLRVVQSCPPVMNAVTRTDVLNHIIGDSGSSLNFSAIVSLELEKVVILTHQQEGFVLLVVI